MHAIYKYTYNTEIIYIGKTDANLDARIKAHSKELKFEKYNGAEISFFKCSNSTETTVFEKLLINKYQPLLNSIDRHDDCMAIHFIEPVWEPYGVLVPQVCNTNEHKVYSSSRDCVVDNIVNAIQTLLLEATDIECKLIQTLIKQHSLPYTYTSPYPLFYIKPDILNQTIGSMDYELNQRVWRDLQYLDSYRVYLSNDPEPLWWFDRLRYNKRTNLLHWAFSPKIERFLCALEEHGEIDELITSFYSFGVDKC